MSYPKSSVEFEVSILLGYDTALLFLVVKNFLDIFVGKTARTCS